MRPKMWKKDFTERLLSKTGGEEELREKIMRKREKERVRVNVGCRLHENNQKLLEQHKMRCVPLQHLATLRKEAKPRGDSADEASKLSTSA